MNIELPQDNQCLLYNVKKPYQYVGAEYLSYNKDFNSVDVKIAFAFPDKYEIAISNLGQKILYDVVNSDARFMADRVYAPDLDYREELIKNNLPLLTLESKKEVKSFEFVGFSLQYELAYPTVLEMLKLSNIAVERKERTEDDPIIMAGGPCCFNPRPMQNFIDIFMVGDGEELLIEILETYKKLKFEGKPRTEIIKELSKLEGVFAPQEQNKTRKRIFDISKLNKAPKAPVPFSSSVHDRTIIEIRRGCGRMCRFCQAGHVNLPIRERNAQDIIDMVKESVSITGYDEYSLLSLSSNDYKNIESVIEALSDEMNKKKVSVSLPSQRIDRYSTKLAKLVQGVRATTATLAPEAGSQRLRNVIKKNISEEQIINAALTLYENGWSKLKFYFICGLPTETLEDMDEMAELLNKIKYRAKLIKREKGLTHGFEITCTLSIFVPKPFTPFQWCGQMDLDEVTAHIAYLKEKTKHIKGLKINYHEKFVSQIEAVLTRGDSSLCKYIEALYKKGCYLDSWGEHFNKDVWRETAEECGISLKDLAKRQFDLYLSLPWDFINVGLEKSWLQQEYCSAFKQTNKFTLQPTCENRCVNCGVCNNLKTKKVLAKPYIASNEAQEVLNVEPIDVTRVHPDANIPVYRYRLKITKKGLLKYFSHLDWQNTFHKVLARTGLRMAYTLGFNPTMKVSMGIALPLFAESEGELVDIEILDKLSEQEVMDVINPKLPSGAEVISVQEIERYATAVDISAQWAEYKITPYIKSGNNENFEEFRAQVEKVLSMDEILITKKTKKKQDKVVDFKNSIGAYRFDDKALFIHLKVGQGSEIPALRADDLMKLVDSSKLYEITRLKFLDEKLNFM